MEVVRNRKEAHRAILTCLQFLKSIESAWAKLSVPGTVWIDTHASARGVGWRAKKVQ